MNRMHWIPAVLLAALIANAAPAADSSDPRDNVAYLTVAACETGQAYARHDLRKLDELNADDYMQTDVRGVVVQRAEYAQYVQQRKSQLTIDCDHIEVRFYGDAAVVTGGWTYTLLQSRGTVITHSRWTSMWTRYPTGWKRHVFQNSYVNPDANKCAFDEAAKTKAESTSPSPASTAASSGTTAR